MNKLGPCSLHAITQDAQFTSYNDIVMFGVRVPPQLEFSRLPTRHENDYSDGMGGSEGERGWTAKIQLAHGGGGGGAADANGGLS